MEKCSFCKNSKKNNFFFWGGGGGRVRFGGGARVMGTEN